MSRVGLDSSAFLRIRYDGPMKPELVEIQKERGFAYGFVGPAASFAEQEDASGEMSKCRGTVGWIEWVEAPRGRGSVLLGELIRNLERRGARIIGLQVVPKNAGPDDPAVRKLIDFYGLHGFVIDKKLAPWSDYPVMVRRKLGD